MNTQPSTRVSGRFPHAEFHSLCDRRNAAGERQEPRAGVGAVASLYNTAFIVGMAAGTSGDDVGVLSGAKEPPGDGMDV